MSFQAHPDSIERALQPPRKVVAGYFLSLDGVAEAPDRFITAWDDETDASGANLIATQDAVILGRRSYDEWAEFWPGSEIQPFASFINAVPKYVATSTPLEREWAHSRVIDGGLVDFVWHLKGRRAAISASTAAFRSLGRCLLPTSSTSSGSSVIVSGGREVPVELDVGQVRWLDAQDHQGRNVGDTASHSIFIELNEPRPTPAPQDSLGPTTF
jgi:hypothetical protein